jgi:ankyrin repeat protein
MALWVDASRVVEVFTEASYLNVGFVWEALDAAFPVNTVDSWGKTLLHYAVRSSVMRPLVQRLLASGGDPNLQDDRGQTPVHLACREGDLGVVRALVAAGGLLNAEDERGNTAVFYAVRGCNNETTECLEWLAARPEVDWCHVNCYGNSVLEYAGVTGHLAVVSGAVARQRRWSPLRAAFVGAAAAGEREV